MGVSSSGKSTIGELVSKELNSLFLEGDRFHTKENIEKMKNGIPLNDKDRKPWFISIKNEIETQIKISGLSFLLFSFS